MKLSDHTNHIRQKVQSAVSNRLDRLGIAIEETEISLSAEQQKEKERLLEVFQSLKEETGTKEKAYEKLVDELTFTLFNRIAALKVSEAHTLIPEMITQRPENGNRSFSHTAYLEQFPDKRNQEQEGLVDFISFEFQNLAENLPLYSLSHYYHLMPSAMDLKEIIDAFNAVEVDKDVDDAIWQSDDVLGWLYESYNNYKKIAHKDSKAKTEYDKVSIQSQVYTPKWVVKFLVDNSLGKQYLEMYPYSDIKNKYAIANAPTERVREPKPLHEIKLIDPAMGSGNFLLYAFDVFYELYQDQIDNFGADYDERDIPKLILEHNLYGVDLDNRAAQIAQLGLYIKARRKKRNIKIEHFNLVSSDFILPPYEQVKHIFFPSEEKKTTAEQAVERVVISLWDDLMQAHKFGALIRIEEIVEQHLSAFEKSEVTLFTSAENETYLSFRKSFINDLYQAVSKYASTGVQNFMQVQAANAVTYLDVLTNKYDVAVANPPYTDSADFGPELKTFVEKHYKKPYKFHTNLYATFIKRCCELTNEEGKVAMIHPLTFMYIGKFEDVRNFILENSNVDILFEIGLGGVFTSKVDVDVVAYILNKSRIEKDTDCIRFINYKGLNIKENLFYEVYQDIINNKINKHHFKINQNKFRDIKGSPFIYWLSDSFLEKLSKASLLEDYCDVVVGLQTGSNEKFLRYWWEVDKENISKEVEDGKKWVNYAKGGPFNSWYGNNWAIINWQEDGFEVRNIKDKVGKIKSRVQNSSYYFKKGITYSASGSLGVSFRQLNVNSIFDVGGSCIFTKDEKYYNYLLGFLNTNLVFYLAQTFNPTVNTQVSDLKKIPFLAPSSQILSNINTIVKHNIELKKSICKSKVYNIEFNVSEWSNDNLVLENLFNEGKILFNEYLIDDIITNFYDLDESDIEDIIEIFGKKVGGLPLTDNAKKFAINSLNLSKLQIEYLDKLQIKDQVDFSIVDSYLSKLSSRFTLLDICTELKINPFDLLYYIEKHQEKLVSYYNEICFEHIYYYVNKILIKNDDGIIPLYKQNLENSIIESLIEEINVNQISIINYSFLEKYLNKNISDYIENDFFSVLTEYFNLFRHFPKSPNIWHLSSGKYKAFEVYTSIYQWNRDSIFKLKAVYAAKRREQLQLRLSDIREAESAAAQAEKELIANQFIELDTFETKLDELIAENYNPILDSGVAKNIAPLQKKGMIKADILKAPQLTKYLNADW